MRFQGEEKRDLIARYEAGESIPALAAHYGTTTETVRATLGRNGVTLRTKPPRATTTTPKGYVRLRVPRDDPFNTTSLDYMFEHRHVMARHLGRPLEPHETVHHINGDRTDNRLENLQLRIGSHGPGSAYRCRCCGSIDIEPIPLAP